VIGLPRERQQSPGDEAGDCSRLQEDEERPKNRRSLKSTMIVNQPEVLLRTSARRCESVDALRG